MNSGIIRGGSNAVDRTVEVRAPVPIHLAVRKLNTSGTTRVSVRLRSIALHVGEVTANIQVTVLNQQSLHLCGIAIATLNLKVPGAVNLTGGRVQNDEVVNLLAIHLGKFAANCQAVIRQSLKSLNLAVESRAEGTNQLTRIHVVTSQVRLINALAASRLHILEVATGEDGVAYLSNSLNVSVHLVLLAGASLFTGAPTNGHRVAIGQSTTVAGGRARTNLREVQVTLSQLRAQEHLSEGDRVTEGTALVVNIRIRILITEVHQRTVRKTNLVALVRVREETNRAGGNARSHLRSGTAHMSGAVNAGAGELHGAPTLTVAHRPGPLLSLRTLNINVLPLGSPRIVSTAQAHAVGKVLRLNAVQQRIDSVCGKLDRSKSGRTGGVLMQLIRVAGAIVGLGPTLTTATNHDPAAAISFLIAVELCRAAHLRGVQPVSARGGRRINLLDLVTGSSRFIAAGTVMGSGRSRGGSSRSKRCRSESGTKSECESGPLFSRP